MQTIIKKRKFIVEMDDDYEGDDGGQSEDENDSYDHVCAICDNGGEILLYGILLSLP